MYSTKKHNDLVEDETPYLSRFLLDRTFRKKHGMGISGGKRNRSFSRYGNKVVHVLLDSISKSLNQDTRQDEDHQDEDPFSFTLPSGEVLKMVLHPIPASVLYHSFVQK